MMKDVTMKQNKNILINDNMKVRQYIYDEKVRAKHNTLLKLWQ